MRFKIRTKLLIIFFSMITLYILGVGYASIYAIRLAYNSVNIIDAVHREEHYSHNLQLAIDRILMPVNDYIITGDRKYIDEFQKLSMDMEKLLKEADGILSDIERLTQTAEKEERDILKDIETGWLNMKDLSLKILEIPNPVGSMDAARLMEELDYNLGYPLIKNIDKWVEIDKEEYRDAMEDFHRALLFSIKIMLLAFLFIAATGALFTIFYTRRLNNFLDTLHKGADAVAKGDFKIRVDIKTGDEFEQLSKAINEMAGQLDSMYANLEGMVIERTIRIKSILDTANDAVICMDVKGGIYIWNKKAEEMFGYSFDEVVGKEIHKLIVPEKYREKADEGLKNFFKTGQCPIIGKVFEVFGQRRDGREFPIELSISAVRIGGEWQAIGIIRDIAERKKAEEVIKKSQKELEDTFNSISDPLFIHDKEFRIVRVNKAYQEAAGMAVEEITGKAYYEVFPKMAAPFKMCLSALELQEEEEEEEEEFSCPLTNRIFNVRFYPIRDVNGKHLYSIHIMEDITERKKAEGELINRLDELEQFRKVTIQRELRMEELKRKNKELEEELKILRGMR